MNGNGHCFLLFLSVCAALCSSATIAPGTRTTDYSNTAFPKGSDCENMPCAWGVYVPFTRRFHSYLKNTCNCPSGTVCMVKDDDISVSAYVYRCDEMAPDLNPEYTFREFAHILPDDVTR